MIEQMQNSVSQELVRTVVTRIHSDGSIAVLADETRPCDVLLMPGTERLAPGDGVIVWYSEDSSTRPVVMGRVGTLPMEPERREQPDEIVIEARQQLTLRCGDGSITIRQDGKILIKGRDLVSHARRLNRIRGGSVAIN